MRKILLLALILTSTAALGFAQSAGGGISFFFPESILDGSGSVSKEAGLSTSLGIGEVLSIPVGFTYIKASGFTGYKDTDGDDKLDQLDDRIWYTADTFIPYVRLKGHFDLGNMFVEGFGGIAGAWIVAPQAFEGSIGRYYGTQSSGEYYVFNDLDSDFSFGWGYQVGAAFGLRFDALSISLEGIFTDLKADTEINSTDNWYYDGSTTLEDVDFTRTFTSRLRGISIGINGSYEF